MQQASTDAASLEPVSFVPMEDMTAEDAAIIANHYEAHDSEDTATQVLRLLHESVSYTHLTLPTTPYV